MQLALLAAPGSGMWVSDMAWAEMWLDQGSNGLVNREGSLQSL